MIQRKSRPRISARAIRSRLRSVANQDRARVALRYFKTGPGEYGEGDKFLGISAPQLRSLAREFQEAGRHVVSALMKSSYHEERALALLVLIRQYAKGNEQLRQEIHDFYLKHIDSVNGWDLVDVSAEPIVGAHLYRKDLSLLDHLSQSGSLWERRISVLATFYFIKKNEFATTLRLAKVLLQDKHDLIHKAVGWMLREIGERDLKTEEAFLQKHYRNMPRTMLRYAIEKFPEPKRKRYLLGKISTRR